MEHLESGREKDKRTRLADDMARYWSDLTSALLKQRGTVELHSKPSMELLLHRGSFPTGTVHVGYDLDNLELWFDGQVGVRPGSPGAEVQGKYEIEINERHELRLIRNGRAIAAADLEKRLLGLMETTK